MIGNRSKSAFFRRGKGHRPPTTVGVEKTTVIAVSCGIKISAVHYLVLSQHTHLTDRRTDGRMDRIASAISCVALHAAR